MLICSYRMIPALGAIMITDSSSNVEDKMNFCQKHLPPNTAIHPIFKLQATGKSFSPSISLWGLQRMSQKEVFP